MIEFTREVVPSMALALQPNKGQANQVALTPDNLFALVKAGPAWAVRLGGKLVALGGHTPMWEGRTVAWGYLAADCRAALPAMTRRVKQELRDLELEFPRVEAYAERGHAEGERWLQLLGFRREGVMQKFAAGRDYIMYAKVA